MKQNTCPDQEEKMNRFQIGVGERERKVKCFRRVPDLLFPAEGKALGDMTYEGRLNADGL
jgi:hypothetical protein